MLHLIRIGKPEDWVEPYRQIFAQAVLPVLREPEGKARVLRREHVKGIRLMLRVYRGHRATMESLPDWIIQAAKKENRKPELERAAERVRQNFGRLIELQKKEIKHVRK